MQDRHCYYRQLTDTVLTSVISGNFSDFLGDSPIVSRIFFIDVFSTVMQYAAVEIEKISSDLKEYYAVYELLFWYSLLLVIPVLSIDS